MNKKKLLFMTVSMPIGGIESALLAMLKAIDYDKYEVDLLLVEKRGERLLEIPDNVSVIEVREKDKYYLMDAQYASNQLKNGKHIFWSLQRCYYAVCRKICKKAGINYDTWEHTSKHIAELEKKYDAAIDYSGSASRYLLDKVIANKKITWNHFDYSFFLGELENDKKYFNRLNKIVSVSPDGAKTLIQYHPSLKNKITYFYNLIDRESIRLKSMENIESDLLAKINVTSLCLCSVGRLQGQKDFSLAIRAAKVLKERQIDFVWYIVGEGAERRNLEIEINRNGLEENVYLLGAKKNPYSYMKQADIYIQTSVFEGRCVAVTEAQALYKPVVVTDVQGLRDLVEEGKTGFIVDRNPVAVADAIMKMTSEKIFQFEMELKRSEKDDRIDSMERFYSWIED